MGMGFEAQAAHPCPTQIWVPPRDVDMSLLNFLGVNAHRVYEFILHSKSLYVLVTVNKNKTKKIKTSRTVNLFLENKLKILSYPPVAVWLLVDNSLQMRNLKKNINIKDRTAGV